MRRIPATLRIAPQPVQRVRRVSGDRILAKKYGKSIVGVRLVIQVGDPGDAPLAVVRVSSTGKIIEDALIVGSSLTAVEFNPIEISRGHRALFGPLAGRIFLDQLVDRAKHLAFLFVGSIDLREGI